MSSETVTDFTTVDSSKDPRFVVRVQPIDIFDPQPRRPVQRGALRHVPLIDSSVHRRRILVQPGLDMLPQVEAHGVMEIDRAVRTQPVEDLLLFVVLRPRERRRVERIRGC